MNSLFRTFAVLALAALSSPGAYLFRLDTTNFQSHPAGPFELQFSLVDGGGSITNTVEITALDAGTGSLTGAPVLTGGAIAIPEGFRLEDSSFDNRVTQAFTPGAQLSFLLSFTTLVEIPAPDAFTFSILDSTGSEVPTTGLGHTILYLELSPGFPPELSASGDSAPAAGGGIIEFAQPQATEVPEPSTTVLLLTGTAALLWCTKRNERWNRS